VRGGRADLIFVLAVSWTLLAGGEQGIVWALIGGVTQDLLTGMPLGTSALVLVVAMFALSQIAGQIGRANLIVPLLAIGIGTGIYHLLMIAVYAVLGRSAPLTYSLINVTLPTLVLNLIIILPVFRVMGRLYQAITPRRVTL